MFIRKIIMLFIPITALIITAVLCSRPIYASAPEKVTVVIDAGHGVKECDRLWQMRKYSDYILSPDLSGFRSTDVDKTDEMFSVGYACAKQNMFEIKQMLISKKVKF